MLTPEQLEAFDARGFVQLRGAFAREAAAAMEARVWRELELRAGAKRDHPASWPPGAVAGLQALKRDAVFDAIGAGALPGALDALLGAGAWARPRDWGQMLVSFPTADRSVAVGPWHTDFDFRGHAERPRGALVFSYLSDVPAGGGGTLALSGSHRVIARFVERHPPHAQQPMKRVRLALMRSDPWLSALDDGVDAGESARDDGGVPRQSEVAGVSVEVVELTGAAGDVVVGHPWLLHRASANRSSRPRLMRVQRVQLARTAA